MGKPEPTADGADVMPVLLSIWQRVFEVEVSTADNFFDLDGDSFTAMRILARIRDELECEISIADLLDFPTVAELAAVVQQSRTRVRHAHPEPSRQSQT